MPPRHLIFHSRTQNRKALVVRTVSGTEERHQIVQCVHPEGNEEYTRITSNILLLSDKLKF